MEKEGGEEGEEMGGLDEKSVKEDHSGERSSEVESWEKGSEDGEEEGVGVEEEGSWRMDEMMRD